MPGGSAFSEGQYWKQDKSQEGKDLLPPEILREEVNPLALEDQKKKSPRSLSLTDKAKSMSIGGPHDLELNDESQEPDEEDITSPDPGGPFFYIGKKIADTEEELRQWMETNQFWPDVWFISDHGNAHLITKNIMNSEEKPFAARAGEGIVASGFNLSKHKLAEKKK